jgi:uncharacterized FAD-dependent dehydrogenase
MEKIVIIGAGVAGVNAATKLVDNGYPGKHIVIIDMGNDPYKRKPEEVMTGFMGAGGWSDGKLTYHTAIGGHMSKYCGEEKAMELFDEVINNFKRFHPKPEEVQCSNPEAEPDFIKPYFGLRLFPVWHVGTDYLHEIGKNWYDYLVSKGVNFIWNSKVSKIHFDKKSVEIGYKMDGHIYYYDRLIFAVGKSGIDFGKQLADQYTLPTEPKPVQIGVRFEAPQKHFQKLIDISYDFKLYRKFEDEGVSLRSFCTNNNAAYVALEETYGDYSYNGHAKKDEAYRNDMTNFGILMEVQGIDKPFEWSRELVSKVQKIDIVPSEGYGGKRAQGRFQAKYKAGLYYSPWIEEEEGGGIVNRLKSKTSEGDWVKAHYITEKGLQEVRDHFQGYFKYIEDFIEDMKKVFPTLGDDWGMYIPEVKYLSPEPLVNYDNLALADYDNVHFVGDALSARGITVSGAQGTYVAENIIENHRDKLFFHLEDANYIGGLTMPKQ